MSAGTAERFSCQQVRAVLRELSVRNFALIEGLRLELPPGFVALTGETGAGKSILMDALGWALTGC